MAQTEPVTCYRHPDRETGRRCTRCGRPACPECLHQASVGSHCVECVREGRGPATQRVRARLLREHTLMTNSLVVITFAVFIVTAIRDQRIDGLGATSAKLWLSGPLVHHGEWYRLFTVALVHFGLLHIVFNMLMLWVVGNLLEPGAGPWRIGLIYIVSVLGGSAGALIASPHVATGGASGGVFGLAAAATLVLYRQGLRFWDTGFGPLLVINLVLNLADRHVSIGGHVGGLIAGVLATEAMLQARKAGDPRWGYVSAVVVGAGSFMLALAVAGR